MLTGTPPGPSARLTVEALEDRTVLSSFGAARGLSIAVADIATSTGGREYITGSGPGREAVVRFWSTSGTELFFGGTRLRPFGGFTGGVFVAAGNLDDDNETELIVSTGAGGTGRVKVFEVGVGGFRQVASFIPFGVNYTGGVDIAVGNVTGGRAQEIIVGQQSGGSQVKVFSDIEQTAGFQFAAIRTFRPFGNNFFGGVSLAAANIDSVNTIPLGADPSDYAEVIVGKASQEPRIKIFDVQQPTATLRGSFIAFDTSLAANRQGVNLAAGSTDAQRGAEIYVAIKGSTRIRFFRGATSELLGQLFPLAATGSRMLNMAIGQADDDTFNFYGTSDLVVVRADGPYVQDPFVYPGQVGSPAGLNGGS